MNPKQFSPEDLAMFALQLLSPEETAEIITHLEHNEGARAELAQIQGDLALYALTSELHSPPALARERLLRRVAKEKKLVPREAPPAVAAATLASMQSSATVPVAGSEEPMLYGRGSRVFSIEDDAPVRRGPSPVVSWLGWAVAAGVAIFAGVQFHQRQALLQLTVSQAAHLSQEAGEAAKAQAVLQALTDEGALQVDLHTPVAAPAGAAETPKPSAHAAYIADSGQLVFVANHLNALQPYKTYELWVIPADGRDPIPAGTFKPDARGYASVILPELPKGIAAKTFGVTVEDEGGAKAPTPPIVLAGM